MASAVTTPYLAARALAADVDVHLQTTGGRRTKGAPWQIPWEDPLLGLEQQQLTVQGSRCRGWALQEGQGGAHGDRQQRY